MKKLFKLLFLLLFSFSSYMLTAQANIKDKHAFEQLTERGEIYFRFTVSESTNLSFLTKIISIDNIKNAGERKVYAYANRSEFESFLEQNITYELLDHPGSLIKNHKMLNDLSLKSTSNWDFYPSYESYIQMMYQFQTDYPGICEIINIGQSTNGRDLLYAKLSDNVSTPEAEPRFNYTSSMHGDETTGYVLMLRLIDYLLSNYGTDAEATMLIDSMEIWINPLANPDGTFAGGNNTVSGAIRYNANYVDLNRNYPNFEQGANPDGNAWQAETIHMMDLADSIHFVMGGNFHGGAEVLNYPWDTKPELHPDDNWWVYTSNLYVDTVHANSTGGYLTDLNNGITNGFAWYVAYGSRQDYMNFYKHSREITFEISSTKNPAASSLPGFWNANHRALINYLKEVNYGIRGIVTDSLTGIPIKSNIFISGHDADNTDVNTELPFGDYYRLIYAGTYAVTYSSPGYQSKTINITVANGAATIQDVQLAQVAPLVSFTAEQTSSCTGIINFIDETNTSIGSSYLWSFGDGTTSTETNPVHEYTSNGTFTVSLTVSNSIGSDVASVSSFITINRPDAPQATPASLCGSGIANLSATGTDSIYWYDTSAAINPIHIGNTYTTPSLSANTSYYVQNVIAPAEQSAAKADNTGGGTYYMNNSSHYLVFDCYTPVTLKSVKVYSNYTGDRTILLRDNQGNILEQATVNIGTGEITVPLNFNIPAGTDFELVGPPAPGLYRNNDGLTYPYVLSGILSVKESSASTNPTGYYYFFYDWKVQEEMCTSALLEVPVFVAQGQPIAGFSSSTNNDTAWFANSSVDGASYLWNFGDGTTSTEMNPEHIYQSTGTYSVSLEVTNACGTDNLSEQINIIVTSINEAGIEKHFSVFPNPVSDVLNIEMNQSQTDDYKLIIYNSLGQLSFSQNILPATKHKIDIDVSAWAKGLYIINIIGTEFTDSQKIIIK